MALMSDKGTTPLPRQEFPDWRGMVPGVIFEITVGVHRHPEHAGPDRPVYRYVQSEITLTMDELMNDRALVARLIRAHADHAAGLLETTPVEPDLEIP